MAKNKHNQPTPGSNKSKKRRQALREATLPLASLPWALQEHIGELQINSTTGYLDWCRQNGFPCGIYKTWEQLHAERELAIRCGAQARVRAARGMRRPDRILRQIVAGSLMSRSDIPEPMVHVQELLCSTTVPNAFVRPEQRALARRLIRHLIDVCPDILFERVGSGGAGEDVYLIAILRLAEHPEHVSQDIETWRPRSYNARRRFGSLARHLYGRFEIPGFLDGAWFDGEPHGVEHRRWFVLVGAGKNLRTSCRLPIPLTRKMAHFFLQAPDDYTVLEALRFGQVLGMGGDRRLMGALRGTRLGTVSWESEGADGARSEGADGARSEGSDGSRSAGADGARSAGADGARSEGSDGARSAGADGARSEGSDGANAPDDRHDFWASVLRFFIRHPMLDTAHIGPILDYLHHQRFENRESIDDQGRLRRQGPAQPNLSMQGRTPESLLRQLLDWHRRLGLGGGRHTNVTWPRSGIAEFRSVEGDARKGNQRIWTIREITNGGQLVAEGRKMRHCVATYIGYCRTGRTSIWGLQVEQKKGPIRMLTIEVDTRLRRIVQARGRDNELPTELGKKVMGRWAAAAGLTFASWV